MRGPSFIALDQNTGEEGVAIRAGQSTELGDAGPDRHTARECNSSRARPKPSVAYNPGTGQILWEAPGVRSHPIPTPVHNSADWSLSRPAAAASMRSGAAAG